MTIGDVDVISDEGFRGSAMVIWGDVHLLSAGGTVRSLQDVRWLLSWVQQACSAFGTGACLPLPSLMHVEVAMLCRYTCLGTATHCASGLGGRQACYTACWMVQCLWVYNCTRACNASCSSCSCLNFHKHDVNCVVLCALQMSQILLRTLRSPPSEAANVVLSAAA